MNVAVHDLAVAVMVLHETKILLVKGRRRGWEFPGGYVGNEESIKEAAIREVKEEAGIEIELVKFCGIYRDSTNATCVFQFLGKPIGGDLTVDNESFEAGYYTMEEAETLITWENYKERIKDCLNEEIHPFIKEVTNQG